MALFGGITLPGHPDPTNIQRLDLLPLPQIRRMERFGVMIDVDWMRRMSAEIAMDLEGLRKDILDVIPPDLLGLMSRSSDEINIDSPEQMAELLYEVLEVGKGHRLKRTKSGKQLSTGKKQLETLKREHPVIPKILQYKELSKLKGTFCDKLPDMAILHTKGYCTVCESHHWEDHWRIHSTINTTRTIPGRLSMKDPNLQQIPSRTKRGREVRKGFRAAKGKRIVTRDVGQLHLRLIAHLSGDEVMISIFRRGGDIHVETARKAFGLGPTEKPDDHTQRAPSKTTNFLVAYGGTGATLLDTLIVNFALGGMDPPEWLTLDWCNGFIDQWFGIYAKVRGYFDQQYYRIRRYEMVWCPFGRVRLCPEVRSVHERIVAAGMRQGGNHPIIAMEAGMMKIAQARVESTFERVWRAGGVEVNAIIPVHDEIVVEVDEDWAEEVSERMGEDMAQALVDEGSGRMELSVPIITDGKVKERWEK